MVETSALVATQVNNSMTAATSRQVRSAAAYLWPDRIVVHPWRQTVPGFGISGRPISSMEPTDNPSSIGLAVLNALRSSLSGVPAPDYRSEDWKALQKETWKAADRRSLRSFMRQARYVEVRLCGDTVTLEPTCNGGVSGKERGFRPILGATLRLAPLPAPEVLGDAIAEAWKRCSFAACDLGASSP
jgi:hypothetical protein